MQFSALISFHLFHSYTTTKDGLCCLNSCFLFSSLFLVLNLPMHLSLLFSSHKLYEWLELGPEPILESDTESRD
ncbi:hypothetical protein L6452_00333 [Arctium lappa]|uniref:Uncharacterized protein n=1 Tax=Arctium lappa TaxID=4217 RepID=A0ACB9FEL5_ARCLA|nr:hypothetical protein L6452_00333 [Arctium lappa]